MKNERDISPLDFIPQLTLEPIVVPPRRRPKKTWRRRTPEPEPEPEPEDNAVDPERVNSFSISETMENYKPKKHE